MTVRISLLAHNGVAGANDVPAFAGATMDANDITLDNINEAEIRHEGRDFTFSHMDDETFCFRERAFGSPSDWAIAREQERAARG